MTASAANGFAHVLFQPNPSTCHQEPYTFRPMYATSSEHTRGLLALRPDRRLHRN
jgi:hypothetical protein